MREWDEEAPLKRHRGRILRDHSHRNATIGSTFVARRAGR
jgi:hypothetical protein